MPISFEMHPLPTIAISINSGPLAKYYLKPLRTSQNAHQVVPLASMVSQASNSTQDDLIASPLGVFHLAFIVNVLIF